MRERPCDRSMSASVHEMASPRYERLYSAGSLKEKMALRLALIQRWLDEHFGAPDYHLEAASDDASFRHYLRLYRNGQSFIVMDAPPQHEDCGPFVAIAGRLREAGLEAPEVLHADMVNGLLLLSDLGARHYSEVLEGSDADTYYDAAIAALVQMQSQVSDADLPPYDRGRLRAEMALFPEWLLSTHLNLSLDGDARRVLDEAFSLLEDAALAQARVFVHRDYHCRNLMLGSTGAPGILDFQDAVSGPLCYDLVSLLRDAYICLPEQRLDRCLAYYLTTARAADLSVPTQAGQLRRDFDLMGAQRHLKVAGIFARLYHRDGKARYLQDIPRVMSYLVSVCNIYEELHGLGSLLQSLGVCELLERRAQAAYPG